MRRIHRGSRARRAHRSFLWILLPCLLLCLAAAAPAPPPGSTIANPDFENGETGQAPPGWTVPPPMLAAGYEVKTVEERPEGGQKCLELSLPDPSKNPDTFGNVSQTIDATPFRGKRVRFSAAARIVGTGPRDTLSLYLRVERASGLPGFFDSMAGHPIHSAEWARYQITGDVAADAKTIKLGFLLLYGGRAWLDSARFEVLGEAGLGNQAARPLAGRGLDNLVAFTRLLGDVRYFHPSDQADAADWDTFAIAGVQRAEKAADAATLARTLDDLIRPLAPTVRVFPTGQQPPLPEALRKPDGAVRSLSWRHLGMGRNAAPNSIYKSVRVDSQTAAAEPAPTTQEADALISDPTAPLPRPEDPFVADLGGGVSALIPLAVWADASGTLPHTTTAPPKPDKPDGFIPSGDDRATRLADISLAWNLFQHFYPYFDVAALEGTPDWSAVLRSSLLEAAADRDDTSFLDTMNRLVAALHDGHGFVGHVSYSGLFTPAFTLGWIEHSLVATWSDPAAAGGIRPGDVILSLDGEPAEAVEAKAESLISAATPQFRRSRALTSLCAGAKDGQIRLEVRSPDGSIKTVTVRRTLQLFGDGSALEAQLKTLPDKLQEMRPGIFYVDLSRIDDKDFEDALPRLAAAKGVVFDLRGYPKTSPAVLQHLTDRTLHSAQWLIPVITRPDQQGVTWNRSHWTLQPLQPRLTGKLAFLTGGGAISYAESILGIVEAYKLAAIVGGPTAGTNGNINPVFFPGSYQITWTGMKVIKHDGSRHHGVGIQPTVPVEPTRKGLAARRDEVLEKGLEVVE